MNQSTRFPPSTIISLLLSLSLLISTAIYTHFPIPILQKHLFLDSNLPYSRLTYHRYTNQWRFDNTPDTIGDCKSIPDISYFSENHIPEVVGKGWSKETLKIDNKAVKRLNFKGVLMEKCLEETEEKEFDCLETTIKRFIQEIGILLTLQTYENVPKLFSYCIPADFLIDAHKLAMITELGAPLDNLFLLQVEWSTRVSIVREIIEFLHRIQPFLVQDLRRQQFVLIDEKPMYVDFDDVIVDEECRIFEEVEEKCRNAYSKTARRLYEEFIDGFFWFGSPTNFTSQLEDLKKLYDTNNLNIRTLQRIVTILYENF